jgi:hypothetical protein
MLNLLSHLSCRIRVAAIRDKGHCPCPRCLVRKPDIHKVGQARDLHSRTSKARTYVGDLIRQAREFIYKLGYGVKSAAVERLLQANSWVPTLVISRMLISPVKFYSLRSRTYLQRDLVALALTHM